MSDYQDLCTYLASELTTELGFTLLDYSPKSLGLLFQQLPVGVVDEDDTVPTGWVGSPDQGDTKTWSILIELYFHIAKDGTGRDSEVEAKNKLAQAETKLLKLFPHLEGRVRKARIVDSKVEKIPGKISETGIMVRLAWIRLEVEKNL